MAVAIMCRVSTDEQKQNESIKTQKEFGERYCALHELSIFDIYLDDGVSGTLPMEKRPEGARLLKDAQAGKFDTVLIYRLDRLGRDPRITLNTVHTLEAYGVQVKSMTEPFDTTTPAGKLMLTMLAGFAGFERDSILARSREGTERGARDGAWLGGIAPYGYRLEGVKRTARLTPSEEPVPGQVLSEVDIVRWIYRALVEEGRSCVWIADRLNDMGVPPSYVRDGREIRRNEHKQPTVGIWRAPRVRSLVVQSVYKGIHVYGKTTASKRPPIERASPALVSPQVWERAQAALQKNMLLSMKNAKHGYLLRGLIKCGDCGLTYVGTTYQTPAGKEHQYYQCNGKLSARHIQGQNYRRCPSKSIPTDIEKTVWRDVERFLRNPGEILAQLGDRMQDQTGRADELRGNAARLRDLLSGKVKERDTVISLFRKGRIDEVTLDKQLDEIQFEEARMEKDIQELSQQALGAEQTEARISQAADLLTELNQKLDGPVTPELKRHLIETLVEKITVQTRGDGTQRSKRAEVVICYCFGLVQPKSILVANSTGIRSIIANQGTVVKRRSTGLVSSGQNISTPRNTKTPGPSWTGRLHHAGRLTCPLG